MIIKLSVEADICLLDVTLDTSNKACDLVFIPIFVIFVNLEDEYLELLEITKEFLQHEVLFVQVGLVLVTVHLLVGNDIIVNL